MLEPLKKVEEKSPEVSEKASRRRFTKEYKQRILEEADRCSKQELGALYRRFGGWSLYLKDGKPSYAYSFIGLEEYKVAATKPVAPGKATIRMNFDYDGGGVGKGGIATILVNGERVASGRIERTQPAIFSADETAGVGIDDATPVTNDYKERDNAFTGKILKVTVDVKPIGEAVKAQADAVKGDAALKKALAD
ncbi:MAG: hypothetical protein O3C60_03180 [Planctomycetota bacterium]|nr:hypothetical protein [Planctomycetota bacterium]